MEWLFIVEQEYVQSVHNRCPRISFHGLMELIIIVDPCLRWPILTEKALPSSNIALPIPRVGSGKLWAQFKCGHKNRENLSIISLRTAIWRFFIIRIVTYIVEELQVVGSLDWQSTTCIIEIA